MPTAEKVAFGTRAWIDMVGKELCAAVTRAALPADLDVSLLERYSGGDPIAPGLLPGFRLDIRGGRPSYRLGAGADEAADVIVDASLETVGIVARMLSSDPAYGETIGRMIADGSFKITGDPSRLGSWTSEAHDIACNQTI